MVTKILIAMAAAAGIIGLGAVAFNALYDGAYQSGYATGVADTNQSALREAEKKRVEDQKKIDDIGKRAEAEIASRTATNVKKAIDDVRKTNPACSLTVPASVLDQLRKR